jgi:hypothetical protein
MAKLDFGTGHNMTPGKSGGGMHRTDSIDLVVVISGEGEMSYPDEDGELKEIHLKVSDFVVQNGNFHEWRNRSGAPFVVLIVTLGAERKATWVTRGHQTTPEAPVEERAFVDGILCIGSISFATPEDAGLVVASGSHGGRSAAPFTRSFKPRLVFFNDAGFGADRAGAAALPLLDSDGIAAATVAADSACIGDGQSTLTQGIISAVNETAYRLGARVGETALKVARILAERPE